MSKLQKRIGKYVSAVVAIVTSIVLMGIAFATPSAKTAQTNNEFKGGKAPKYVFLFIGDGMSFPQISTTEMYLGNRADSEIPSIKRLNYTQFPTAGVAATFDAQSFIPDSASTGTSIASGFKTLDGVINMDVQKKIKYDPISRLAKKQGYKVGVVSSVSIDHATPATFYANEPSRNNYYEISLQLANSNFDYFGGGGIKSPTGNDKKQANVWEIAKKNGYKVVNTKEEILKLNANSGKVIATSPILEEGSAAMPYEIDRKADELSLADFVRKGIDVLDNSKGFFMMVEGGKIDWAAHANDAATVLKDTIAFSDAVAEAVKVYEKYPNDTLIIVTGDHETGGMTIGFAGTKYETFFEKIDKQTMSCVAFDKVVAEYRKTSKNKGTLEGFAKEIKNAYGLLLPTDPEAAKDKEMVLSAYELEQVKDALEKSMIEPKERKFGDKEYILYGGYEPLTVKLSHILNHKAGISFTTYSHTGLPVPVYAIGAGNELFIGSYDNTDIFKKMKSIMKL